MLRMRNMLRPGRSHQQLNDDMTNNADKIKLAIVRTLAGQRTYLEENLEAKTIDRTSSGPLSDENDFEEELNHSFYDSHKSPTVE